MGLIFAGAISGVFSVVVVLKWLLLGSDLWYEMIETVLTGAAPIGFGVGIVFSGGLALYGRRRTFAEMSIWPFVASGAVAGFLLSRKEGWKSQTDLLGRRARSPQGGLGRKSLSAYHSQGLR